MPVSTAAVPEPMPPPNPSADPASAQTLVRLLEQVVSRVGVQPSQSCSATAMAAIEHRASSPWWDRASWACDRYGLATHRQLASVREVVQFSHTEMLWLTCVRADAGHERWLAVFASETGQPQVLVQSGMFWLRRDTNREHLGRCLGDVDTSLPLNWVAVEPALPFEPLRNPDPYHIPPARYALKRIRGLLHLERRAAWLVLVYAIWTGIFALATPLTVQVLVNTVAFGAVVQPLIVLVIVLFGLLAMAGVLRVLQAWVGELVQRRLFARLVTDLAHRLPRTNPKISEKYYLPELVNRFFDVVTLQKASSYILLEGVELALEATIGMILLAFYHPLLLAFDFLLIAALSFIVFAMGRNAISTSLAESDAKYAVAAWFQDVARAPMSLKSRAGMLHVIDRAESLTRQYLDKRHSHWRILYRQIVGVMTTQVIASAMLLGLGGWLVLEQELTLGQLVASELIVSAVVYRISSLGKHFASFYDLSTSISKVGKLVDLPLEPQVGDDPPPSLGAPAIRLENVSVTPGAGGDVLTSLTLDIPPGCKMAITGPVCSGKSAILDLLFKARRPSRGLLSVDGADLTVLNLAAWRDVVELVRDPEIVAGTIDENVRLGVASVTAADVQRNLDLVGLLGEVARLPGGVHTQITSSGSPLSESQRLRLTLARALSHRPRLLLVDGALDRLPTNVRLRVLNVLCAPEAPWTLVVVSQSEDVLSRCDRVARLENGKLVTLEGA